MVEPINLNRARKARAKTDAKAQAAANRAKHGRASAQKAAEHAETTKALAHLDAHRRDREP